MCFDAIMYKTIVFTIIVHAAMSQTKNVSASENAIETTTTKHLKNVTKFATSLIHTTTTTIITTTRTSTTTAVDVTTAPAAADRKDKESVTVRKCCEFDKILKGFPTNCENNTKYQQSTIEKWPLPFYNSNESHNVIYEVNTSSCDKVYINVYFNVGIDGMFYDSLSSTWFKAEEQPCVDVYEGDHGPLLLMRWCRITTTAETVKYTLVIVGASLSLGFLTLVLLCFGCITALRDPSGHYIANYAASNWLMFVFILVTKFATSEQLGEELCILVGILFHLSILLTFFWLFIICLDIYLVIRSSVRSIRSRSENKIKFILYYIIGWCVPLLIIIICVFINFFASNDGSVISFLPEYGLQSCFLSSRSIYYYVYSVCLVPYTTGLLLLAIGGCSLYRTLASTELRSSDNQAFNNNHAAKFWQKIILFIIVTVCWSHEFLSAGLFPDGPWWLVIDFLNSLQGVFISVLFTVNKKRRVEIHKSLKRIFKLSTPVKGNLGVSLSHIKSISENVAPAETSTTSVHVESSQTKSNNQAQPNLT